MEKKVIVICAISQDGVYGKGNAIPWKIKEEMQHFKQQTTGHTVVMGRGTWESLPPKFRPLPSRDNMVVTNTPGFKALGALVVGSVSQAIDIATTEKVFLIGGTAIWYEGMKYLANEALITVVKADFFDNSADLHMAQELLKPPSSWNMSFASSEEYAASIPFTVTCWVRGGTGGFIQKEQVSGHRE